MKIGTILGVAAAAAAVAAIATVAPARAAPPANDTFRAASICAADCDTRRVQPTVRPGDGERWPVAPEPPTWLLVLTGFIGLGVMLRAARPAFPD